MIPSFPLGRPHVAYQRRIGSTASSPSANGLDPKVKACSKIVIDVLVLYSPCCTIRIPRVRHETTCILQFLLRHVWGRGVLKRGGLKEILGM